MGGKKNPKDLAKMLAYILGRKPYEFGLVPDGAGYVRVKSLLQALSEEQGWKHVRESHLREVLISIPEPPVEMGEGRIRARQREHLPQPEYEPEPPGLLFHCVRRRAWPHVRDRGLVPTEKDRVCLAADPQAALRRGRRIDPDPVLVTVHTAKAPGVVFFRFGPELFLADQLPADALTGPPLPKAKEEPAAPKKPSLPETPGSFFFDPTRERRPSSSEKAGKPRKKDPDWKRERRKSRKR
jgi:putative RNA 2'-phosphotransferase